MAPTNMVRPYPATPPPGFVAHEYHHIWQLNKPRAAVWAWLCNPDTFTEGQVRPYRVEFLANAEGPGAVCRRCGEEFASVQQIADLKEVLPQVGFDYSIGDHTDSAGANYQDTCPQCRRAQVALSQSARVKGFG